MPAEGERGDILAAMDEWGPEKVVCVHDRRLGMRGVLVVDNTARGMGKGGTRMSPTLTVAEVARLARAMTWKWAAADLLFGGAKAGIRADPGSPAKEEILRSFARRLANEVPREYVFGLDMGLTERDAAIVADELGPGSAVGTPADLGGLPYDELGITGYGVAEAADSAATRLGRPLAGSRIAVQGFGAVGRAAARRVTELGGTVVAISTVHGGLHRPGGLDVAALTAAAGAHGDRFVEDPSAFDATAVSAREVLFVDADVLIPAATQDVLDAADADRVPARLVVEGANLPTTAAAQASLAGRGVTVVPDIVANAGGAIAAGYAMDARASAFPPDPAVAFDAVARKIRSNTDRVLAAAARDGVTPHAAALGLARDRVRRAMLHKGQIRAGAGER
ncbi:Glu/Leu/Phe/Val dehydrogenase dimerization domain-containing protein [Phytohabitans sp. ZYX-F-186]|uniref:Glutamate dehydrogenase n=1 Tax=Phytohabitans maris TaxID=3071409 RepID=A0ABU0ZQ08_9ACTN|nr:Glu/Leu/Phe/Val dehydrogenase dimerization domain-containing protein [Phytohabitans sp. ZYX-F-186]MDQ7908507.1 Glu/Leu/Phe/Val dehydrogenase dimerization domain-containing protein [Phytohabitans sp. ZYX-F-186]